jgi:hypothetical protein
MDYCPSTCTGTVLWSGFRLLIFKLFPTSPNSTGLICLEIVQSLCILLSDTFAVRGYEVSLCGNRHEK